MTTTVTRRIAATLAVSAVLVGGQAAAADETHSDAARPDLTLGGQPLGRFLHADPARPGLDGVQVPLARLNAHADAGQMAAERQVGRTSPKRRGRAGWIGAGVGAGLGMFAGAAASSLCYNEGGSHCWSAFPVLGGLAALAGYGIGKCISALGGKIGAIGGRPSLRVSGRTMPGARRTTAGGGR